MKTNHTAICGSILGYAANDFVCGGVYVILPAQKIDKIRLLCYT